MSLSNNPTFQQQEQDAILNRRLDELVFLYQSRQTEIVAQLQSVFLSPQTRTDLEQELRRIGKEVAFLNQLASAWADKAIPEEYRRSQAIAAAIIVAAGVTATVDLNSPAHQQAIAALTRQTKAVLLNANRSILTNAAAVIGQANMSLIRSRFALEGIDDAITAGAAVQTISAQVEKAMIESIGQGTIMTSNIRNQQPKVFADRYARTRMIEVASQATINTSLQYGVDLVQVSYHQHIDRPGDRCPEFAGNIYSITGTSQGFPQLIYMPPFHPNCRHVLVPVVDPTIRGN